jgi:antitoxin (DNA-binding transcriptional repressor) of toxin-antitoxin stability system
MAKVVGVAEAKKRFSEIMSDIVYKGEHFIVERKGRPMIAMVNVTELKKLEQIPKAEGKKGLLAAIGALEEFKELDKIIEDIYKARKKAKDRRIQRL